MALQRSKYNKKEERKLHWILKSLVSETRNGKKKKRNGKKMLTSEWLFLKSFLVSPRTYGFQLDLILGFWCIVIYIFDSLFTLISSTSFLFIPQSTVFSIGNWNKLKWSRVHIHAVLGIKMTIRQLNQFSFFHKHFSALKYFWMGYRIVYRESQLIIVDHNIR